MLVSSTGCSVSANNEAPNTKIFGIERCNQVGILMSQRAQYDTFRFLYQDE